MVTNPRLWLRLAEFCIFAHRQVSCHDNDMATLAPSDSGYWIVLVMPSHLMN